jgi:hypothetical protein
MRTLKTVLFHTHPLAMLVIRGAEEKDDSTDDKSGDNSGSQGDGEDQTGGDDSSDDDDSDDGDDDLPDDGKELKGALKKERENARTASKELKKAQRELKRLQAKQEEKDTAEKGETEAAKAAEKKAAEKVTRLATRLRDQAVESAVTKAANKIGFRDADDVMAVLARSNFKDLDIDQDEEDPADIEIDEKSVEKALKAIADKKPHWLIADGETDASGGRFNRGKKPPVKTTEEQYKEKYSALRR